MAYTTVDKGEEYFNTVLYTGNGGTDRSITGVGFQPDWVWIKERNNAVSSMIYDSNRGVNKRLSSNNTNAEATDSDGLKSFDSDGWTMDAKGSINGSSDTYAAWTWKANGGTINETRTESGVQPAFSRQTNLEAGFSIVTYTGVGTNNSGSEHPAFLHGLGAKPEWAIFKNRSSGAEWKIWYNAINSAGTNVFQGFDNGSHGGANGASHFGDAAPNTTSFFLGSTPNDDGTANTGTNTDGDNYVCYVFKPIQGYSKFGSYVGNGNNDGVFVYTGFKPAWLIFKQSSSSGEHFRIFDNKRSPFNQVDDHLFASSNSAESDETGCDFLSNGFKMRNSDGHQNANDETYAYACFAEFPFVSSKGTPVTAA